MTVVVVTIVACSTATCAQQPPPLRIEILSLDLRIRDDYRKSPAPGHVFATIHARHEAESDRHCRFEWDNMTILDGAGHRYPPKSAGETRGKSASSGGLFGIGRNEVVKPHEMYATFEIPVGTKIERVVIGEVFSVPQPRTSVASGR